MKEAEHPSPKPNFDIRKRPINPKLFQNQKPKQQFILNTKKTMGKKYMQQPNIFKQKHDQPKKQHRQIVMSEQFIRSSKLYRLLKQKMDRSDSIFIKEVNSVNEVCFSVMQHKMKLKQEIMQIRSENYQEKVSLWQLKNKLMELKIMYHEQEEQSKRLAEQNFAEYDGEEEYEGEDENNEGNAEEHQEGVGEQQIKDDEPLHMQQGQLPYTNHALLTANLLGTQAQGQGQQSKSQFTQILQQLMSLKAERQQGPGSESQQEKIIDSQSQEQSMNGSNLPADMQPEQFPQYP